MLDMFAESRSLTPGDRTEILAWLRSLPWIGEWRDTLPPNDGRDQEDSYFPVVDNADNRDGGLIELHFGW